MNKRSKNLKTYKRELSNVKLARIFYKRKKKGERTGDLND